MRLFRKKMPVHKVRTVQVNNKLVIVDGHNPMRYVDLATNKVHVYKNKQKYEVRYKLKID